MKKLTTYIILFIITYFIVSFIFWDINANTWGAANRFVAFCLYIYLIISYNLFKDEF